MKDTVVVHADESCLGNGREGENPGGAASLIESQAARGIARGDLYLSSPGTTNNRMALCGAIATLALIFETSEEPTVVFVSDSQYLVKGMNDWVRDWRARGWRRKGGKVENVELWQELTRLCDGHVVNWKWVRGHTGLPKNEYVNDLAIRAAAEQLKSNGIIESGFDEWLTRRQAKGYFPAYSAAQSLKDLEFELTGRS